MLAIQPTQPPSQRDLELVSAGLAKSSADLNHALASNKRLLQWKLNAQVTACPPAGLPACLAACLPCLLASRPAAQNSTLYSPKFSLHMPDHARTPSPKEARTGLKQAKTS